MQDDISQHLHNHYNRHIQTQKRLDYLIETQQFNTPLTILNKH